MSFNLYTHLFNEADQCEILMKSKTNWHPVRMEYALVAINKIVIICRMLANSWLLGHA